jgi:hypothetical protein
MVAPVDVEPADVGAVIRVEMGEQDRWDVVKVGVSLQRAECAVAEVKEDVGAVRFEEIARGR